MTNDCYFENIVEYPSLSYSSNLIAQARLRNIWSTIIVSIGECPGSRLCFCFFSVRAATISREFEWVFAVFDRDSHLTYHDALHYAATLDGQLLNDEKTAVRFRAIPSVPCFELWLLLHYVFVQAMLHRDEAFQRLCEYIPTYAKGASGILWTNETKSGSSD